MVAGIAGVVRRRWAQDGAAGRLGGLRARRPARRLLPRARRRAQPGRLAASDLQPVDGPADARARAAGAWSAAWACSRRCCAGSAECAATRERRATCPSCARRAGRRPGWLPRQRRGTTPQMHGRYPDYDVLDAGGALGRRPRAPVVLARGRTCRRCASSPPSEARRCARSATSCSAQDARAARPGARDGRRQARRRAARRLPLRRTCPTTATPGGCVAARPRRGGARAAAPSDFAALRRAAARRDRRARSRTGDAARRRVGRADRGAGVVGGHARAPWRRSTPTRGRGTRSASAARPIRAATCAWAARRRASRTRRPEAFELDPVARRRRAEPRMTAAPAARARAVPADNDSRLPARRPPPRPARPRRACARYARRRRGRPGDRRRRRGRLGARAAAGPARAGGSSSSSPGPFWDPDERLGLRRGRPAPALLDRRRAIIGGERPGRAGQEQLRPRRRRLDGPLRRLHAALPPLGLRDAHARRRRRGLADLLRGPQAPLRARRARAAGRRPGLAVGRPARATRTRRTRSRRRRRAGAARARSRAGIEMRVGPVGDPQRHASATARTASTAASACRAARSTPRRARYVTHLPDAIEHGVEVRADCMAVRVESTTRGRCDRRDLRPRRPRALPARRGRRRRRLLDRDAAAAAELAAAASRTGSATPTTRSAAT